MGFRYGQAVFILVTSAACLCPVLQVEQTLDAEYYWLFNFIRLRFQKRLQTGRCEATSREYDDLKAVALIEREEQQQVGGTRNTQVGGGVSCEGWGRTTGSCNMVMSTKKQVLFITVNVCFILQQDLEASREEMERRMDKHMNRQNKQLLELMEKLEEQVQASCFLFSFSCWCQRNVWTFHVCVHVGHFPPKNGFFVA